MIKIEEHKEKMESIKKQAENSQGHKRRDLMKCYRRLEKELRICQAYMRK